MSIITNVDVYSTIAEEAHSAMKANLAEGTAPRPDGEPGCIKRLDPEQRSFKNALIAIAFAGIYIDALLYILLQHRLGRTEALRLDRRPYQERLERLCIDDPGLLARLRIFRKMRNDLVHEKAIEISEIGTQPLHHSEDAADRGVALMEQLRDHASELIHGKVEQ
jgi:hypothetical protein